MLINASLHHYSMTPSQLFEEVTHLSGKQQIAFWTDAGRNTSRIKIMVYDPMFGTKQEIEEVFNSFLEGLHKISPPFFIDYQILPWGPEGRWEISSLLHSLESRGVLGN